jgi:hypothetical protein
VLLYGLTTFGFFVSYLTEDHTTVTDAIGNSWQTADIYETSALVTVYGMLFIALLAVLRIAQHATTRTPTPLAETTKAKA